MLFALYAGLSYIGLPYQTESALDVQCVIPNQAVLQSHVLKLCIQNSA